MSDVEFLVHEVRTDGEAVLISGIVSKGKVVLGSQFIGIQAEHGGLRSTMLAVEKVVAYRREIGELPTGMSGELQVAGNDGRSVKKHDMLIG
jgi:hypothetical protein